MSRKVRLMTQLLKDRGMRDRGEWVPQKGSANYRVYRWWALQPGTRLPVHENRCHYWRVVFFWAPLRWLAMPALYLAMGIVMTTLLAAVAWGLAVFIQSNLVVMAVITALVTAFMYLVVCYVALSHLVDERTYGKAWQWLVGRSDRVLWVLVLPVMPFLAVVAGVVWLGCKLLDGLLYLHEVRNLYRRLWRWFSSAAIPVRGLRWVHPYHLLVAAGVLQIIRLGGGKELLIVVGIVLGVLVAAFLVGFIAVLIEDVWSNHEENKRLVRLQINGPFFYQLYTVLHPGQEYDEMAFEAWLHKYEKYWSNRTDDGMYSISREQHLQHFNIEEAFYLRYRYLLVVSGPVVEAAKQSQQKPKPKLVRTHRFVVDAADLTKLFLMRLLVSEWKVACPLVKFPEAGAESDDEMALVANE